MGPNAKKRSRKQYVNYRLKVLRELYIAPPTKEQIAWALDEAHVSEIEVDNLFLGCIKRKW